MSLSLDLPPFFFTNLLGIGSSKFLHIANQSFNALERHGIVDRGTDTADRAVTRKLLHVAFQGTLEESLFQVGRGRVGFAVDAEGDIHAGPVGLERNCSQRRSINAQNKPQNPPRPRLDDAAVESVGLLNCSVKLGSFFLVDLVNSGDTALGKEVLEDQPGHVNCVSRRGVVHALVLGSSLVLEHERGHQARVNAVEEVVADNHDGQTGGSDVLLGAKVDQAKLGDVNRAREDVGRHVADERDRRVDVVAREDAFLAGSAVVGKFDTVNGLVGAVVEVSSFATRSELPFRDIGNRAVALLLGVNHNVDLGTQTLSFFSGLVGPASGDDVVDGNRLPVFAVALTAANQVVEDGRELGGGTTLEKEHLVVFRDPHELAQVGLGLRKDFFKGGRTVREFHDVHSGAVKVEELGLCFFEDGARDHGRAGAKVPDGECRGHFKRLV